VSKLFKKITDQKIAGVRQELARAHLIIALLAAAVIMMIIQGATQPIALDATLSTIGVVLLATVILTSLGMSFALFTSKK